MLSVARSRFKLPAQLTFLIVNAFGDVTGAIYHNSTPDFYHGGKHGPLGWVSTWIASIWVIISVVFLYTDQSHHKRRRSGQPITAAAMAEYRRFVSPPDPDVRRWSGDSGQGSERNSSSLFRHSPSPSVGSENQQLHDKANDYGDEDYNDESDSHEQRSFLRRTTVDRFLSRNVVRFANWKATLLGLRIMHTTIEKSILIFGFLCICTGSIIYSGIMVSGP